MNYHLTMRSNNRKTGPMPVSTTSNSTCPVTCPLKAKGCYAKTAKLGMFWAQVSNGDKGYDFETFLAKVRTIKPGQLWRHNQAGDLPGDGVRIDGDALQALVAAAAHTQPFAYSHYLVHGRKYAANRKAIKEANARGFVINLSANTLAEADALAAQGVAPVVAVVPADYPDKGRTPEGRPVIVCHEQTEKRASCAECGLCAVRDRTAIVAFRAHGYAKNHVGQIASGVAHE